MSNNLLKLPPKNKNGLVEIETKTILKEVALAHRKLAELKGYSEIVPNKNILLNAITLNEAKDSSQIENIITTHDELFEALSQKKEFIGPTKEVLKYKEAIWHGVQLIKDKEILVTNMMVEIQEIIEGNRAGIRKQAGTVLRNDRTGEIVYTPPETEAEIRSLLKDLDDYINLDDDVDDLIKMAVIHYQFESIHPFYDGNGRTGRIINILYLVLKGLLDTPILFLSKYIMEHRQDYYRLLQSVNNDGNWEDWILFILKGVQITSDESLIMLNDINNLIIYTTDELRGKLPKIYSKELVEVLFEEFYTRISYVENKLKVTRKTASLYLKELVEIGILREEKRGKEKIFVNIRLVDIVVSK